jgi:UDP-glucose 4-epimerase
VGGAVVGLTGATGHLGGLLLERLLADPAVEEVRTVARRPLRPRERLTHTRADVRSAEARRALSGVSLVFHLAAQVWSGRGASALEEMESVNLGGTRNVLAARPGAVVLASSASVYGAWPDNPLPLAEHHAARPNRECPYAQQKLASEEELASATMLEGRWLALRLAAVLGPHADARVSRSLQGYRLGVPAIRRAAFALQWLDENNAVDGLLAAGRALLAGGTAGGEIVNIATVDWLGAPDMARLAHSWVLALPRWALVGGAEAGKRLGLAPFGADRAALLHGPLALSPAKAAALLGWRPSKTSAEVFKEALSRDWRPAPHNAYKNGPFWPEAPLRSP